MTLFALDPGATNVGWSITDMQKNTTITYGAFDYDVKDLTFNEKMNRRVQGLIPEITQLFLRHGVDRVVWELVPGGSGAFGQKDQVVSVATTLKVLTFQQELPYASYAPRSWHARYLPGLKKVTKEDVKQKVMKEDPSIPDKLAKDVYDAVAIGIMASRDMELIWR